MAVKRQAFSEHECKRHVLPDAATQVYGKHNQCVVCATPCFGSGFSTRRCTVVIDAAALGKHLHGYAPDRSLRDFLFEVYGGCNGEFRAVVQSWMLRQHIVEQSSTIALSQDLVVTHLEVRFKNGQMTIHALKPIHRGQLVLQYACRAAGVAVHTVTSAAGAGTEPDVYRMVIEGKLYTASGCGNAAMLIDHACPPANNLRTVNLGDERVLFRATRDIMPGEKLTFDYLEAQRPQSGHALSQQVLQLGLGFDCRCDACSA